MEEESDVEAPLSSKHVEMRPTSQAAATQGVIKRTLSRSGMLERATPNARGDDEVVTPYAPGHIKQKKSDDLSGVGLP